MVFFKTNGFAGGMAICLLYIYWKSQQRVYEQLDKARKDISGLAHRCNTLEDYQRTELAQLVKENIATKIECTKIMQENSIVIQRATDAIERLSIDKYAYERSKGNA